MEILVKILLKNRVVFDTLRTITGKEVDTTLHEEYISVPQASTGANNETFY